jgi:molecular chaperone DnaJ
MSSKDWLEKDFYAVLGVPGAASTDDIKKAYRRLARELHPDRNPNNAAAEERFKAVSEAYDVLSDDRRRKEYDEMRQLFGSGAFRRNARARGAGNYDFSDLFAGTDERRFATGGGGGGFSDLFSSIFSGAAGGRRPGRGRDVETEVVLSFVDAVRGATLPLTLRTPGTCESCMGSGAAPGTQPRTCTVCRGVGLVTSNQGSFSFSEPCRECQGVGTIVEVKCPECRGTGGVTETRTLNVRIPAGVSDGQRIRLAARGEPGERNGPPGDLFVLIKVQPHPVFRRAGDDITLTVPVTFAEAVLGADIQVPTLDGGITMRVAPGTPSGRTLRVRGKGVVRKDGRFGDLLVTVHVDVPTELSAEARKALEEFPAIFPPAPRDRLEAKVRERSGGYGQ